MVCDNLQDIDLKHMMKVQLGMLQTNISPKKNDEKSDKYLCFYILLELLCRLNLYQSILLG